MTDMARNRNAKTTPIYCRPIAEQWRLSRRWFWPATVLLGTVFAILSHYFTFGPNLTHSLPIHAFFVIKNGKVPTRGGFVAFHPGVNRYYLPDSLFVKHLVGLPGDTVTYVGRTFYVNGKPVAVTKPFANDGQHLDPGPAGVLPACRYFVATKHPDGYDSRYADIGWVRCDQIVGTAYAMF